MLPMFKDHFEEGSIYVIEKLMVAQNDPTFGTTPHKYKLNFIGGGGDTTVFKLTDSVAISKSCFQFMSFVEILACHKEDRLIGSLYLAFFLNVFMSITISFQDLFLFKICIY